MPAHKTQQRRVVLCGTPASAKNHQYTFNPFEKYIEAMEENKKLYQDLLKEKDEKIALLESMAG